MKKKKTRNIDYAKPLLITAITAVTTIATTIYLTMPAKTSDDKKKPFTGRNFAHRGLFSKDQTVPENSVKAFELATEAGYGIELDVHITKDNKVVVFHDDTLDRVCGIDGRIEDCNWSDLKNLRLYETTESIPLLQEVLDMIAGRIPIILELKPDKRRSELCEHTYRHIINYSGEICIESFDPRIVAWFRKNAPNILRGQLSQPPKDYKNSTSIVKAFLVGNLLTNCLSRPNFIAYKIGKKPLLLRLNHMLGAMKVAWTSHSPSSEKENDAVIFEHYKPGQFLTK